MRSETSHTTAASALPLSPEGGGLKLPLVSWRRSAAAEMEKRERRTARAARVPQCEPRAQSLRIT
ncbi:Uncharacterized protein DAT39_007884, partial [Clarias magur]